MTAQILYTEDNKALRTGPLLIAQSPFQLRTLILRFQLVGFARISKKGPIYRSQPDLHVCMCMYVHVCVSVCVHAWIYISLAEVGARASRGSLLGSRCQPDQECFLRCCATNTSFTTSKTIFPLLAQQAVLAVLQDRI